jgi:membrane-bound lytic murein transglycosylase D
LWVLPSLRRVPKDAFVSMPIHPAHKYARSLGRASFVLPLSLVLVLAGCETRPATVIPHVEDSAALAPPIQPVQQAAPAPPALTPQQQQAQRATQQLIVSVERAFAGGENHYRQGQLVQAKADFDNAVDMMLASGIDIKNDAQLSDEFNRILDAVNGLEMEALKQGNGFAPKVEPTPADVANDVTFEVDPNLVAKAKSELATTKSDLPLVINDYVASYINFFANTQRGHNTLMHSFQRSGRYKAMIQRVLQEEGVPQDLIYLAVAESSFQPQAVNHSSGAGGMWQFMPHGDYGLTRNGYVDERFDPEKSTRAYARYMKFLYNQLGDWYLAMAAYDWGAGSIQHAVQKTGYADFWELYKRNNLPVETKNYVPEILAAIIITKNPTQYGFENVQFDAPVLGDTVSIDYSVDLRLVADIVEAQPQDLLALNPGLLRLVTPPPGTLPGPFDLHLPLGTATLFQQRIADVPVADRTHWRYHRVSSDDTLAGIARSFHISVEQLAGANDLHSGDTLDNVDAVVVPVPVASSPATHTEVYKTRRGDTLVTIADRFGTSLEDLRLWNHVTGNSIVAGQRIRVSEPARLAPRTRERSHAAAPASTNNKGKRAAVPKPGSSAKKSKTATSGKTRQSNTAHKTVHSKSETTDHKNKANKNLQK